MRAVLDYEEIKSVEKSIKDIEGLPESVGRDLCLKVLYNYLKDVKDVFDKHNSKYVGKVLEGRFEVIGCYHPEGTNHRYLYFKIKNIFNNEIFDLTYNQMMDINKGRTTVGRIISKRIRKAKDELEIKSPRRQGEY